MNDFYNFYVTEGWRKCGDEECLTGRLHLEYVSVQKISIVFKSTCHLCGYSEIERIKKENLIFQLRKWLEKKFESPYLDMFRMILYYPHLCFQPIKYKEFLLETIYKLRKTILIIDGKKKIAPNLWAPLEKKLKNEKS